MSRRTRLVDSMDDEHKQAYRTLAHKMDLGYKRDESEPFHPDDMVWALNTQTGLSEVGKVIYTFPESRIARISFGARECDNGYIVHMSADIPYSDLRMHKKSQYVPNASIVNML